MIINITNGRECVDYTEKLRSGDVSRGMLGRGVMGGGTAGMGATGVNLGRLRLKRKYKTLLWLWDERPGKYLNEIKCGRIPGPLHLDVISKEIYSSGFCISNADFPAINTSC